MQVDATRVCLISLQETEQATFMIKLFCLMRGIYCFLRSYEDVLWESHAVLCRRPGGGGGLVPGVNWGLDEVT